MTEPRLITNSADLAALTDRLRRRRRLALDTEAASFHRYVDRVYLVQVSSDDETAIVDPLAVDDLAPIGTLMSTPDIEVIFHDADYDLRILDRDYGFRARRIWDTRIAAQLAGERSFGLGSLLEKYFGIRLSKKLQRADWSKRPLTPEMIAYAAADTAHLLGLRDLLKDRLERLDRLYWAEEEFALLADVRWTGGNDDADPPFLRLKGAKQLRGQALAVLRAVWEWRDRTAREADRAPFRILGNDAVVEIARTCPTDMEALREITGVSSTITRRYGDDLLAAVRAGSAVPEDQWPKLPRRRGTRPDPEVDARYQRLRALRAQRAEAVELDPGLVCPNATLLRIARETPAEPAQLDPVEDLRKWQREVLGDDAILRAAGPSTG